jgi:hypothetical protein
MTALAGRKALVRVAGAPVAFTDEATTGDVAHEVYNITATTKNCWDPTAAVTVKVDGVAVTTGFTIERLVGRVTFAASQGASVITVSGSYLPLSTAAGEKQFTTTRDRTLIDVSDFGSDWKKFLGGMLNVTGSLGVWYQNDSYFFDAMDGETPVVLEFFADSTAAFTMRVWTTLTKAALSASVDAAIDESIDWSGTADADDNVIAVA